MGLITCKKCSHIYSALEEACPYCNTANPFNVPIGLGANRRNLRKYGAGFILLGILIFIIFFGTSKDDAPTETNSAHVSTIDQNENAVSKPKLSCINSDCPVGTKAVTRSTQQGRFYTCKSGELADYANYVLNISDAQTQFAGNYPGISGTTGEPEVKGNDQLLLDKYRTNAGVSTFEEALSKCYKGIGNLKVVVLNNPKEISSIYVVSEENQDEKFWLPKAKLELR